MRDGLLSLVIAVMAGVPLGVSVAVAASPSADEPMRGDTTTDPARPDPRLVELLATTYLGHAEEFPDPEEPYEILAQYLQLNAHGQASVPSTTATAADIDFEVSLWEGLANAAPRSRHGYAALGGLYERKFEQTKDKTWLLQSVTMYSEAARIARSHGRIRYTDKLASALTAAGDVAGLSAHFAEILSQLPDSDPQHYYLALVDYANALAKMGQLDLAWQYFEEAIARNPKECIFAVNLYTGHLLDHHLPERALDVVERVYTKEERIILAQPAFTRKRALEMAGLTSTSADEEVKAVREISNNGFIGGGIQALPSPPGLSAAASYAHTNAGDDCRVVDYHSVFYDNATGYWFYSYTVNMAEVLYNEARGERRGAQAAAAWTIRNRALEVLKGVWNSNGTWGGGSCDSYPGDGYAHGRCSALPCNDVNYENCAWTQWYCCAIHGGTTTLGAWTIQFNDAHVDWQTLAASGLVHLAFWVENGKIPDSSSGWAPPNVYNCYLGCNSPYPWCNTGSNFQDGSPNGAMEYRHGAYVAKNNNNGDCKFASQYVCSVGGNYFWNRTNHLPVGLVSVVGDQTLAGCAADPDTPWFYTTVDVYVDGPPGAGFFLGTVGASLVQSSCVVGGVNYGANRGFLFTIPTQYRHGGHMFYVVSRDTSNGIPGGGLSPYPIRGY